MDTFDIVIIGAGWHGLSIAKTYLEAVPNANLVIFDSASSVGGVWAKERLYPGLKTNNLVGSYEFSDFPMTYERFGVSPGQHIPGSVVHEYLAQFVQHFGLLRHIRLQKRVKSAELQDDSRWALRLRSTEAERLHSDSTVIMADKLVVATGLTSEPFVPKFIGKEDFGKQLFHAKELHQRADGLHGARSILVLGGNKSAWDTTYFAAKTGAHVHMVIRPSGGGPSWIWPVFFSPLKLSVQRLATTRLFTWFDPCIWSEKVGLSGWLRYFLHKTFLGQRFVSMFWYAVHRSAHKGFQLDDHPQLQKLKPWVSAFWMGNSLSVHNYKTCWFDLVREGRVTIHIADVTHLSKGKAHLSNDQDLEIDALICCTGWITSPPLQFLPETLSPRLGIVHPSDYERDLVAKARSEVFKEAPAMRTKPLRTLPVGSGPLSSKHNSDEKKVIDRYYLYRFMVPSDRYFISQRNIAFIGAHLALSAILVAQAQALWITAFFTNRLPNLHLDKMDDDEVKYSTILHNEYTRIRHPHGAGGAGDRCPDLTFDCLSYVDLLLTDLGLKIHRKYGLWSEIFNRYGPSDYRNLVQEWLNKAWQS